MFFVKAKLGIVNLAHATQIYPWERSYSTGVAGRGWEVRATFQGGDTISLSDHATREEAEAAVVVLHHRLLNQLPPSMPVGPSFVRDERLADAEYRAGVGAM